MRRVIVALNRKMCPFESAPELSDNDADNHEELGLFNLFKAELSSLPIITRPGEYGSRI